MGDGDTYNIEELAAAAGMTPRNVRAYRTRGLLPEPLRHGRVTRYDRRHLERLLHVRALRRAGIPLRLITEVAGRGTELGPESDLWRLTPGAAPDPGEGIRDQAASSAPAASSSASRPASVDVAAAESSRRSPGRAAGRVPLDAVLVRQLDRDVALRTRLIELGLVSGPAGRHCSTDVGLSLRGLGMHGVAPATALALTLQAAEVTGTLAARLADLLDEGGHSLTPAVQDTVEALTVAVTRHMLVTGFHEVR